jgi:hypothetical protein
MNTKLKYFVAAIVLVSPLLVAGCSGKVVGENDCKIENIQAAPTKVPAQTVAILAPTSNFVDFETIITRAETPVKNSLGASLPDEKLKEAVGSEFSVVLADGKPRMIARRSVSPLGTSAYDIRTSIDSTYGIFRLTNKCAAGDFKSNKINIDTSAGSDMLKALSIAADQLDGTGPRKIFILGNGIQTAGAIQMQEKGQFPKSEISARLLAQGLKGIGEIPELRGAEVNWYGLGEVDGYNQELSEKATKSLVSFWTQVIKLGHGTVGDICSQCGAGKPNPNALEVPYFSLPRCQVILYESDGVEFKPNSNQFVNPAKAQTAANEVKTQFSSKGCDEMSITGYAAAGVDKDDYSTHKSQIDGTNKALTKSRAATFMALIRKAGFTGTITTAGGGTCGTEWSASGAVDLEQQRLCRRVEVSN